MKDGRFEDIAIAAGVGIATVDRVLNNRGGVRPQTARRVIEAARRLGVNRVLPTLYARPLRIDVILSNQHPAFYRRLGAALTDAALSLSDKLKVQQTYLDGIDAETIARKILADRSDYDGIVVVGSEHPGIRNAIAQAHDQGKAVVTLVTDITASARLSYVGINNDRAGRTAGHFLARMLAGNGAAIVVIGDEDNLCQRQREHGFRSVLQERYPALGVAATLVGREDEHLSFRLVADALDADHKIIGLYNTAGAVGAVADAARIARKGRAFVHIAHELTPSSRRLLSDGSLDLVIDQNPELQARRVVENIAAHFGLLNKPIESSAIPFTIHGCENAD